MKKMILILGASLALALAGCGQQGNQGGSEQPGGAGGGSSQGGANAPSGGSQGGGTSDSMTKTNSSNSNP
jgi:hypothetical protein